MKTVNQEVIDEIVQRVVAKLQPEAVYLYGSHAYGKPHSDSDLDLLVVIQDTVVPLHKKAVEAYSALRGLFVPAEIKVVTRSQFERRSEWLSSIERTVKEKGKILYDFQSGRN